MLACLSQAPLARAGCPNTCTPVVGASRIEPPLDCATFTPLPQDCDCGLFVKVHNACSDSLEAQDFTLTCAGTDGCKSVSAGADATITLPVSSNGHKTWSLSVNEKNSGDHTLQLALDVSEFDDDSGCAFSPRRAEFTPWALALLGLALMARRSRRQLSASAPKSNSRAAVAEA